MPKLSHRALSGPRISVSGWRETNAHALRQHADPDTGRGANYPACLYPVIIARATSLDPSGHQLPDSRHGLESVLEYGRAWCEREMDFQA
jgi:hypothetical protein